MKIGLKEIAMAQYTWAPAKKRSNPKVTDSVKSDVKSRADELIENVMKP